MPKSHDYESMFEPWQRMMRLGDMLRDSSHVVQVRTRLIAEAAANPLDGNYDELCRMVPEKADALAKATLSMASDMLAVQSGLMASWTELMGFALRPRVPTAGEFREMASRRTVTIRRAAVAGDKALGPIAAKARSNAQRLK